VSDGRISHTNASATPSTSSAEGLDASTSVLSRYATYREGNAPASAHHVAAEPSATQGRFANVSQARKEGERIANESSSGYWFWRDTDPEKVVDKLRAIVLEKDTPQAAVGEVISSALTNISRQDRAVVATELIRSLKSEELRRIGTKGLSELQRSAFTTFNPGSADISQRIAAELTTRMPRTTYVNGVRITGEGISAQALAIAATQMAWLTSNPEIARKLRGYTVEIYPRGERKTDQELSFAEFGNHVAVGQASENIMAISEEDLLRHGTLLSHELMHGVHFRLLNDLGPFNSDLKALLEPGTGILEPFKNTRDGAYDDRLLPAAEDLIRTAYEQRKAKGSSSFVSDYAQENEFEWLADSAQSYLALRGNDVERGAQWLRDHDPSLFQLLQKLYGPSPQLMPSREDVSSRVRAAYASVA